MASGYNARMAIKDEDILVCATQGMTAAERLYLPEIVRGFGTTIRHLFTSFGIRGRQSRAMQYPEERKEHFSPEEGGLEPSNFRGVHRLNRDEAGG